MSYMDQATQAYIETLRNRGMSDNIIQILIVAFVTGFSAGTKAEEDETTQLAMIDSLLEIKTVN